MSNTAKGPLTTSGKGGDATVQYGHLPANSTSGGQAVRTFPFHLDPVIDPITVTGAKGGNAALTSLVSALVQLGFVIDQTS